MEGGLKKKKKKKEFTIVRKYGTLRVFQSMTTTGGGTNVPEKVEAGKLNRAKKKKKKHGLRQV